MILNNTPLLGFAGFSGTGKTTLLEKVIPLLIQQGMRVSLIKHAHHDFDIDYPGKDSYRLRKAGASETLVASKNRWALIHENQEGAENLNEEPDLSALLSQLDSSSVNIILVEGFKHETIPRIELHRNGLNNAYLYPDDNQIVAIATDLKEINWKKYRQKHLTVLDINNPSQIAHFILTNFCER